jgi:hypothetical protein
MIPSSIDRLLLPTQNPWGFDAVDFVFLGLAALLTAVFLVREQLVSFARKLAGRSRLCLTLPMALPIALRLALLGHHPIPVPRNADDFSYLLLGDTLAHFRLANPMHPLHRFFEGVFILQTPSYSSIYPLGQGLVLAFGQWISGQPWVGVALSVAALCALCYWMLRAWVNPAWALTGGLLAAIEFGPLSPWMNTYWGGAVSGVAGCLVFGALPRLKAARRTRDAVLLGLGLGVQLLTRPFEFALLLVVVILFLAPLRSLLIAALALLPFFGLTMLQNRRVTGSWLTLPYQLSRYQYGIPTTFTFQPVPVPHQPLTVEQRIDYDAQSDVHGTGETPGKYLQRLAGRLRFYRFFFLAPLYLVLPAFLFTLREYRFAWLVGAFGIFWLGGAFYPYFYPHYIAAETCLFLLVSVLGLQRLSRLTIRHVPIGGEAVTLILAFCLAHFVFWYGIHLGGNPSILAALSAQDSWDVIDYYTAGHDDVPGRIAINRRLAGEPGKQLVFVRYWPQRTAREWIQNRADIDRARIAWAIDLGPAEDKTLLGYYPDRRAWLLEPDARPPRLVPYNPDRAAE